MNFPGFFEHYAHTDDSQKVATRKVLAVARKRFNDRFIPFLYLANSRVELESRLDLIRNDIVAAMDDVCDEHGADAEVGERAASALIAEAKGAFCDDCRAWKSGPRAGGCSCEGGGEDEGEEEMEKEASDDDEHKDIDKELADAPSAVGVGEVEEPEPMPIEAARREALLGIPGTPNIDPLSPLKNTVQGVGDLTHGDVGGAAGHMLNAMPGAGPLQNTINDGITQGVKGVQDLASGGGLGAMVPGMMQGQPAQQQQGQQQPGQQPVQPPPGSDAIHHEFSEINPGQDGGPYFGQPGQPNPGQAYDQQHLNDVAQQMHINPQQVQQGLQQYNQNLGPGHNPLPPMQGNLHQGEALETVELPNKERDTFATGLGDKASPKIDKSKSGDETGWDLEPIDTQMGGSPHPSVEQDVGTPAKYDKKDFLDQTDAVAKQETLPTADDSGQSTDRNIKQPATDTWSGMDGQTDPITSAVDPDKNPVREILENEYDGFLPASQVEAALQEWSKND